MAKILITGITGFIGRNVLDGIIAEDHQICALLRPNTVKERYAKYIDKLRIEFIDLADSRGLQEFLAKERFDTTVHNGALRGGRKATRNEYDKSNVGSPQQFVAYCLATGAQLIFCSSVGVFGAIPSELPANAQSPKNADNYYHYTKIECEKYIGKAVLNGLNAMIIRPSITYGKGDYGFPYQLVKLVAGYRFPLVKKKVWIHLCHIEALVAAFKWALDHDFKAGLTINVADREPVQLAALVDFISRQTHKRNYPRWLSLDQRFFKWGEDLARVLGSELFISRFQLISQSWFYDVQDYYALMELEHYKPHFTIPQLQTVIDFYKDS